MWVLELLLGAVVVGEDGRQFGEWMWDQRVGGGAGLGVEVVAGRHGGSGVSWGRVEAIKVLVRD